LEEIVGRNGTVLKDEEKYQEYVNKIRTRNGIYKRYRNDIAALKAECGVLSRTIDILRAKADKLSVDLSNVTVVPNRGHDEAVESKSSDAWLASITQATASIAALKAKLTPVIVQIKPLKDKLQNLTRIHEDKKKVYDRTSMSLNTNLTKLVNEVNDLQTLKNAPKETIIM
jgi:intraflagellar transport protein 81